MALLSQALGMGQQPPQQNPFAQFQQMQANPFTRQLSGENYLPSPQAPSWGQSFQLPQSQNSASDNVDPTDFAGSNVGFPNLPENMQGMGLGATAPQENVNSGLHQQLIQQLFSQLMQSQGMGGMDMGMGQGMGAQMMGGMGNFGGF